MITTTDVFNILTRDCKKFGVKVFQKGNLPNGEVKEERITIHAKRQTIETYWNKGFVEVNFCVPDVNKEADLVRLNELERLAVSSLEQVGEYDGTHYRYSVHSSSTEQDISFKCHFVNVRILFEVLNIN